MGERCRLGQQDGILLPLPPPFLEPNLLFSSLLLFAPFLICRVSWLYLGLCSFFSGPMGAQKPLAFALIFQTRTSQDN